MTWGTIWMFKTRAIDQVHDVAHLWCEGGQLVFRLVPKSGQTKVQGWFLNHQQYVGDTVIWFVWTSGSNLIQNLTHCKSKVHRTQSKITSPPWIWQKLAQFILQILKHWLNRPVPKTWLNSLALSLKIDNLTIMTSIHLLFCEICLCSRLQKLLKVEAGFNHYCKNELASLATLLCVVLWKL